jgi:hypothetical protein
MCSRSNAERRIPPALAVAAMCLLVNGVADLLLRHESGITGDERYYERMASHPGGPHNFPYAYRVGVPWLVHISPFSHIASFTALALLAIAGAGGAMYALLREFEAESRVAAALGLGFTLAPPLLVTLLRHGRSVDPAVVLVLTLGTLLIVRRRRVGLVALLLAGTTIHESCLFLIPFAYAVWAQRPIDREALRDVAFVAALPVIVYVVLRTSIDAVGRQYIPGYSGSFVTARWHIIKTGLSGVDLGPQLRRLASAYGVLWLVAPAALTRPGFARRGLVLVALCVASMTFAYGWGRIIFFAAPVFYVASVRVIAHRRRLTALVLAGVFALDLGYAIYMQAYGVRHGIDVTTSSTRGVPVY